VDGKKIVKLTETLKKPTVEELAECIVNPDVAELVLGVNG
jgi:hypothetical protein